MKNNIIIYILLCFLFPVSTFAQGDEAVPIHGFFDIDARYIGKENKSKFSTGYLDFYLSKDLSDRVRILMDLVIETVDDSYSTDLERVYISYDVNEYLQITSGKFHTPYGYWNNAFNYGLQIQTSILRPKFLAFEDRGGILPSHSVGVMADGFINDFSYNVYITSGAYIKEEDSKDNTLAGIITTSNGKSQDGKKLFGVNFAYNMENTKIGIHGFYQNVNIFKNTKSTDVFMYGAFIAMELEKIEFYSELYIFRNKNILGSKKDAYLHSHAFFAQLAYIYEDFKPYIRVETTHYSQDDFYFSAQKYNAGDSYDRAVVGLAYNVADDATIKFAVMQNQESHKDETFDFLTQFAIRF